ncbi:hypothetical protein OWI80_04445 [Mammaliicoccus sciuri]|nr:hypothetical protein [Mammaliicoccus sciuri]
MFVLVVLSGCGKGAEGKLVGNTFSVEVNNKILGKLTFKDNGVLDIKNDLYNSSGSAKYEIIEEDGLEYVVISSRPSYVEDFLGRTALAGKDTSKYYWRINSEEMKLESLALKKSERSVIIDFDDKKPNLSSLTEYYKENSIKLIEEN